MTELRQFGDCDMVEMKKGRGIMGPIANRTAFDLLSKLMKKSGEVWEKRGKTKGWRKGAALAGARSSSGELRSPFVGA